MIIRSMIHLWEWPAFVREEGNAGDESQGTVKPHEG